jgi:hypothetical protein
MTIGSYLLGSAWMAGVIQHTWTFARVYTLLLYLWLFGVLEERVVDKSGVTQGHRRRVRGARQPVMKPAPGRSIVRCRP